MLLGLPVLNAIIAATFDSAMTYTSATPDVQSIGPEKAQYMKHKRAKALAMTTETAPQSVLKLKRTCNRNLQFHPKQS